MIRPSACLASATMTIALVGCGASIPVVPPPLFQPAALQFAPGPGFSLQSPDTIYVVVNTPQTRERIVLPMLAETLATELRNATPADVVIVTDEGLDCPPAAEWSDLCEACHVPIKGATPAAVVIFCDLLEYDPYTPLRVGLAVRVRRASDGMPLTGLQGTWLGEPPITPQLPPFHWFHRRLPPRPNVDFVWTDQFEAQSATALVRHAVQQCVAALSTAMPTTQAGWSPAAVPQLEDLPPPAPPALPEIVPPPPPAAITESDSSVPEESHPSP